MLRDDWRNDRVKAAREVLVIGNDASAFVREEAGVRPRWQPGGFVTALVKAMLAADAENLSLLSIGFPALGWCVDAWKNAPRGAETLRGLADFETGGLTDG